MKPSFKNSQASCLSGVLSCVCGASLLTRLFVGIRPRKREDRHPGQFGISRWFPSGWYTILRFEKLTEILLGFLRRFFLGLRLRGPLVHAPEVITHDGANADRLAVTDGRL